MKASLCPVCMGPGQKQNIYESVCHGCDGKGWVSVPENIYGDGTPLYSQPVDICPSCGSPKSSPGGTGCPMSSHYGTYC